MNYMINVFPNANNDLGPVWIGLFELIW